MKDCVTWVSVAIYFQRAFSFGACLTQSNLSLFEPSQNLVEDSVTWVAPDLRKNHHLVENSVTWVVLVLHRVITL